MTNRAEPARGTPEGIPHHDNGAPAAPHGYFLRLYITGATARSGRAFKNIQKICERYLKGQYTLDIVDLYEEPGRAAEGQVVAAPTLVKERPEPVRRLVGDLSDEQRVLGGLGLAPTGELRAPDQ